MKLRALQLFFRLTAGLCHMAQAITRGAGRLHQWAWQLCDRENMRTLNIRQVARTRFL